MHAIKTTLIMTFTLLAPHALATIVPMPNEVVEATLHSEGGSLYADGYLQLNKKAGTVSLLLQPVLPPCAEGEDCTEVMPAPVEFFFDDVKPTEDACGAVIYQAEQGQEPLIKVTIIDNSNYNYETCPTYLPVPDTVVQVSQLDFGPNSTELKEAYFAGSTLANVRY